MITAFIFDLDGTLIDSEILWCQALGKLIGRRGFSVTEAYTHELVLGRAWSDIVARMRVDYPAIHDDIGKIERESILYYEELKGKADIRIPGSVELLTRLGRRYPVAIVSGSTRGQIADAIAMMGVGEHLRFFLGSEDYGRGKPDPGCFLMAASRFGVEPGACMVFEDSAAGVRAAKAAGMTCVALRRPGYPAQDVSTADEIVSDLAQFNPATYGIVLT